MSTEKQIGPPVNIDGWLIRVTEAKDEIDPVLAKATRIDAKDQEILVTPFGIAFRNTKIAPAKVLEAVLKVGGWKAQRP